MKIPVYEIEKKIALGFSFLNSEKEIKRSLDLWYPKVDYIIAVDGRYKYPYSPEMLKGKIPSKFSTDKSIEILEDNYEDKLILLQKYGTQMEKRQTYMDVAGNLGCDALIVFDTDEYVHPEHPECTDWNRFFKQIVHISEFNGKEVPGVCNMWCWIPDEIIWPKQYNEAKTNTWRDYTRVHINPAKQRYAFNHFVFCPKDANNEDIHRWNNNPDNAFKRNPLQLYPQGFLEGIRFTTDRLKRTEETNRFGNLWAFQTMHEENYRVKLEEAQALGYTKMYSEIYRPEGTYWFDEKGRPINYTKEEQDLFNSLDLS